MISRGYDQVRVCLFNSTRVRDYGTSSVCLLRRIYLFFRHLRTKYSFNFRSWRENFVKKKKKLYKEIIGFGFTPVFRKFWGKIISKNEKVYIKIRLFFFFNIVIF